MTEIVLGALSNIHFTPHEQIAVACAIVAAFLLGRLTRTGHKDRDSSGMFEGLAHE